MKGGVANVRIGRRITLGVDYERELIALCYSFPDREARIRAFRDRRPRDPQA